MFPRYTYRLLLSIEKLIYGGDGLARTAPGADRRSLTVFTPFVLPGEKIDAELRQEKPGFARGSLTEVLEASPDRVPPRCPYFQQCGGCHYQHIAYDRQLECKAAILRETLRRIAKIELQSEIRLHPSPPWNYRNRTRFQVRTAPEFALGYFKFRTRQFLAVAECPISAPPINRVLARLQELRGLDCPAPVEELELFASHDANDNDANENANAANDDANHDHAAGHDDRLLASVFCRRDAEPKDLLRWADALQRALPAIAGVAFFPSRRRAEPDQDAPAGPQPLAQSGAQFIRYRVHGHEYRVSAGAFFQANRHLIGELIAVVTGGARGELALDLYAGGGLFSLPLAQNFHHIFSVEASQTSYGDLRQNVPRNVRTAGARTEDYLGANYRRRPPVRQRPDLVVLDPPRTGAGKAVIRSLGEIGAPLVRYVSCDPATLARDIAPLLASGYRIEEAHLFDLFPETFHVESVLLLAR